MLLFIPKGRHSVGWTYPPSVMADDTQLAAAAASAAVAAGALLAGAVLKRSEWLKRWNPRFAVLTTEQLYYYHSACPTGGVGERRAILLTAGMTVSACDGGLSLSCVPPFHFRCSSDAELRVRAQVENSRPGTSASSPPARSASARSSSGRPPASVNLGQPRPIGRHVLAGPPHRPLVST